MRAVVKQFRRADGLTVNGKAHPLAYVMSKGVMNSVVQCLGSVKRNDDEVIVSVEFDLPRCTDVRLKSFVECFGEADDIRKRKVGGCLNAGRVLKLVRIVGAVNVVYRVVKMREIYKKIEAYG